MKRRNNAKIEGVADNTSFMKGDACSLPFADGTFDAVTSNYCYHNIPSRDRQAIILESLRVLKKGGTFAIHDIFSKAKYGDMQQLLKTLKEQGYEKVELIDTTQGIFMTPKEAAFLALTGQRCWWEGSKTLVLPVLFFLLAKLIGELKFTVCWASFLSIVLLAEILRDVMGPDKIKSIRLAVPVAYLIVLAGVLLASSLGERLTEKISKIR